MIQVERLIRPAMPKIAIALLAPLLLTAARADDGVSSALRSRVEQLAAGQTVRVEGDLIAARSLLSDFYRGRKLRPAWLSTAQRAQLLVLVEASTAQGLDPSDYHVEAMRRMEAEPRTDADYAAERDLLWSDALVRLVYQLHFGKVNPRELYPDWTFSRTLGRTDPVEALEALLDGPDLGKAVERFAPQLALYRDLQKALAQYRAIEAAGGWGSVPLGATLELRMRDIRVQALRARLAAGGDVELHAPPEPELFDPALETAVRQFQIRHGLAPDGKVGRRTLEALNVTVAKRIEQLRVNLERLRWLAQDLTGDYLLIDIAGFSARLYLDAQIAWTSRVVVGRLYRQTPPLRATLRAVVLNPAWIVPPTILREDLLPQIAEDPRYLERNAMRVIDQKGNPIIAATIDWRQYRSRPFPYRLVQAPGPANPLGKLKFDMPNGYGVYLHDTPVKALFERTDRAFSSGCIRIERPRELALHLLDDPEDWSAAALDAAIATGETRSLPLERPLPVMMLYQTADADEHGVASFRPDLYARDDKVAAALDAPFRFSPVDRPQQPTAPR